MLSLRLVTALNIVFGSQCSFERMPEGRKIVSLRSAQMQRLGLAALLLTGTVFSTVAHAQSALFNYVAPDNSGRHTYGLLNGQHVALYINDRGDLGAPYPIAGGDAGNKPGSLTDSLGRPNPNIIAATGEILGFPTQPAYGALFSKNSTANLPIGDSVKAKSEFLGAGTAQLVEGYSLFANDGLSATGRFVRASQLTVNSFTVTGNSGTGPLVATSNVSADLSFSSGNSGTLALQQVINFQDGNNDPPNRVRFSTTFTNNSTEALNGFRYARVVDVNTSFTTSETSQQFRANTDPTAFALTSFTGGNALGIGVFGNSPNGGPAEPGSLLFVGDAGVGESNLLLSPFDQVDDGEFYVMLGAGNAASLMQKVGFGLDLSDDTVFLTTNDFINDVNFRTQVDSQLGFANADNSALMLLSPELNIAAGGSANFTFYYFFGQTVSTPVPEAGTVALLITGGVSGLWLRRRHRK